MRVDWDAPAVVAHGDAAVLGDVHPDVVTAPCHGLVDAVVDDLDYEVVQATLVRAADVHTGASADCFQALEDLDIARRVLLISSTCCHGAPSLRKETLRASRAEMGSV